MKQLFIGFTITISITGCKTADGNTGEVITSQQLGLYKEVYPQALHMR